MPFDYYVGRHGGVIHQFLSINISLGLGHFVRVENDSILINDHSITPPRHTRHAGKDSSAQAPHPVICPSGRVHEPAIYSRVGSATSAEICEVVARSRDSPQYPAQVPAISQ